MTPSRMMSRLDHGRQFCREGQLRSILLCLVVGWLAFASAQPGVSQEPVRLDDQAKVKQLDSVDRGERRTTLKPAMSSSGGRENGGQTYVALAQGLREVFDGKEPSTLQELRLLELQQSEVAKAIDKATVNVQRGAAQGSGVIITGDGYVLTAAHVAGKPNEDAYLRLNDGTLVKARTLGTNRSMDAGLLKIVEERSTPWPHATLGRSGDLKIGQWCVAAGHPGGWKADRGSVIRVGRILSIMFEEEDSEANTLFTDCALIGGDSGGPLFTLEGKLIGIHSRIGTDVTDNMHVPIDVFDSSWDRLVRKESWGSLPGVKPAIGVSGVQTEESPIIDSVVDGGPAALAGMQKGDLVLSVDGNSIATFADLQLAVQASMPGEVMFIKVRRGDQMLRLPVVVGVASGDR